jgi:hypothetical protein
MKNGRPTKRPQPYSRNVRAESHGERRRAQDARRARDGGAADGALGDPAVERLRPRSAGGLHAFDGTQGQRDEKHRLTTGTKKRSTPAPGMPASRARRSVRRRPVQTNGKRDEEERDHRLRAPVDRRRGTRRRSRRAASS